MKSGASDPFADDEPAGESTSSTEESSEGETAEGVEVDTADREEPETATGGTSATDTQTTEASTEGSNGSTVDSSSPGPDISRDELPLVLRRERVKDERPEVHQLFVQQETHERAVDVERDLDARFEESLARTDAREAIYLAGMAHLDDAEAILREWGYDI